MAGCTASRPIRPPLPLPPIRRPPLPRPIDILRIVIEEVIRAVIDEAIRNRNQAQDQGFKVLYMQSTEAFDTPKKEPFDTEALLKSLNEIPSEYANQLQNPEAAIKLLNIDVPPEYMPKVTAALARLHHLRRHRLHLSPEKIIRFTEHGAAQSYNKASFISGL